MRRLRFPKFLRPILLYPLSIVLILTAGTILLWTYPRQAAESLGDEASALERRQLENDYRATGAQLFLGLGVLVGIYLTYRRIRAAERQAVNAEQGQITERFTRAIEQLGEAGDGNLAIRLGGIYALERIMRDSDNDFATVQEVLTAFVREETTKRVYVADDPDRVLLRREPRTDIQAALTVLGRNTTRNQETTARIGLQRAYLMGANLVGAHLERADLWGAKLTGAHLGSANLRDADLSGAHLADAKLGRACLEGALLIGASLEEAYLEGASFRGRT